MFENLDAGTRSKRLCACHYSLCAVHDTPPTRESGIVGTLVGVDVFGSHRHVGEEIKEAKQVYGIQGSGDEERTTMTDYIQFPRPTLKRAE